MIDNAIVEFLEIKKQDYLKKNIKSNANDEDKCSFIQESEYKFGLRQWLINASQRAGQLSMTSHPPKFVHPNAKTSSIIVDARKKNDGLLRSGNIEVDIDVFGNAAALDVEKFLRVKLQDGKTVLQHLDEKSKTIRSQFSIEGVHYDQIRNDFMQIKYSDLKQTSEKLKQVYFPADEGYHLLSILNASGIIYKLKERINSLRFSEENKALKENLKKANPAQVCGEITEVFGLAAVGYGGSKALNISVLNAQNVGVSLLLPSMPPIFEKRPTQPPKHDFFDDCLWAGLLKSEFEQFHQVLRWRKNNKDIRDMRDDIVLNAITKLKRLIEDVRNIQAGWSDSETYVGLAHWQKIWLDEKYKETRSDDKQNEGYLSKVQSYYASWFIGNYKHTIKGNKLLGDDDIEQIKKVLKDERELLQ